MGKNVRIVISEKRLKSIQFFIIYIITLFQGSTIFWNVFNSSHRAPFLVGICVILNAEISIFQKKFHIVWPEFCLKSVFFLQVSPKGVYFMPVTRSSALGTYSRGAFCYGTSTNSLVIFQYIQKFIPLYVNASLVMLGTVHKPRGHFRRGGGSARKVST